MRSITLARAFLPGMLARGSGGILNVASTIAFQPAPYQAVYGASKAFVLSFSQALWAEARPAGVAVTALCPGPTRTGFVEALGAEVGHTAIYRRLADPEPVIEAGLRALDKGRAVVIPGVRNKVVADSGRFMPREWLTRVSARLLRPVSTASRPPIEVHNEIVIPTSAERVWDLLTDVEGWPSWYGACRWVRVESTGSAASMVVRPGRCPSGGRHTRSNCAAPCWPPIDRMFSLSSPTPRGLHAERTFTIRPTPDGLSTVVVSHETQVGLLPRLGRMFLAPRLRAANQAMFDDLARAAGHGGLQCARPARARPLQLAMARQRHDAYADELAALTDQQAGTDRAQKSVTMSTDCYDIRSSNVVVVANGVPHRSWLVDLCRTNQ